MFGENGSVVNSSMNPQGKIHKIREALSFHRVCEATSANIISYHFINGKINPVDIFSKNWAHHCM